MAEPVESDARVAIENVGGIGDAEVDLYRGVNVLTGRNASNKTSFLRAIMAALGSDRASLKGDADGGRVEMTVDGERYSRSLARTDGELVFGGDPYTDDAEPLDLFSFLLESNDARRAVARGDDLREVIMRPVDTDELAAEIRELEVRKREIDDELRERERLADELASLEGKRAAVEERLERKREELAAKRDEIEATDAEPEETMEHEAELEAELAELRDRRSSLDDVRGRLDTEREVREGLRDELAEVEAELDGVPETSRAESQRIERRIGTLRERKRTYDSRISRLQGLIEFNEEMLSTEDTPDHVAPESSGSADEVIDDLLPGAESFVCWTCGADASREDVAGTLDDARETRQSLIGTRREVTAELDELAERKRALDDHDRRRSELDRRRDRLEGKLRSVERDIESLEERREELVEEVARREERVEHLRGERYDEVVDLHTEATELELEVDRLNAERAATEEAIAAAGERLDELERLEEERSTVRTRLEEARTRIDRLEEETVAAFNEHMDAVLGVLNYENLERIWIERGKREGRDGTRTGARGVFDLHVVRSTEDGTVYGDTVDHLSESEREVTGLVFALAGYLTHEVHGTVPFVLLDSVEAIDSERIGALVEYLSDHAEYLVVALLPEDAAAVDDRHPRITGV